MGTLGNSMTSTVKIFLSEDAYISLQDEFADAKAHDLHRFVFEEIKKLCRFAKMQQLNGIINCRVYDKITKQIKEERVNLKDHKLEQVPSDPTWVPKNLEGQKMQPYEIKIGTKTTADLNLHAQMYQLRIKLYNDSVPKDDPQRKNKLAEPAKCIEEILHNSLIDSVMRKVEDNIASELDDEFSKIYKDDEEKPKPKKVS
jgi:hypothetical protein